eukprot:1160569-Pelagomonas_calceolata.AAC.2
MGANVNCACKFTAQQGCAQGIAWPCSGALARTQDQVHEQAWAPSEASRSRGRAAPQHPRLGAPDDMLESHLHVPALISAASLQRCFTSLRHQPLRLICAKPQAGLQPDSFQKSWPWSFVL